MWKAPGAFILLPISVLFAATIPKKNFNGTWLGGRSKQAAPILNMAPNSFDDEYKGCVDLMDKQVHSLLLGELQKNSLYQSVWTKAKEEWGKHKKAISLPDGMKDIYAIAVIAYTWESPALQLYKEFNKATRTAGKGPEGYADYPYKSLHFLLSNAGNLLRAKPPQCTKVYRGSSVEFSIGSNIRFGQFTSTSTERSVAELFGQATLFVVLTCYGYPIGQLDFLSGEEEVVVPPYEMFHVQSVMKTKDGKVVNLRSKGKCSNFNCAFTTGGKKTHGCPDYQVLIL